MVSINPSADAIAFPFYEPPNNNAAAYVRQDAQYPLRNGSDRSKVVQIPITAIPSARRALQTDEAEQMLVDVAEAIPTESVTPVKSGGQSNYDTDDVELYLGADGADGGVHSSATKRRGASVDTASSCQSQHSNKRIKATLESTSTDVPSNGDLSCGFDPNGLKMDSLRLLEAPTWASTSKQAVRRLTMDMKDLHRRQTTAADYSSGYHVHTDKGDNMFQWIVELFNFDPTLPLARDMQELQCPSIVMELRFGPSYPMSPPFVRVVRPQFVPFAQGGGGHVTAGGAVCLELLTNSGWNPAIHIENVILQIRAAISEPDPPARIHRSCVGVDYGVGEAVAAFTRLAHAHGWTVPDDFKQIAAL